MFSRLTATTSRNGRNPKPKSAPFRVTILILRSSWNADRFPRSYNRFVFNIALGRRNKLTTRIEKKEERQREKNAAAWTKQHALSSGRVYEWRTSTFTRRDWCRLGRVSTPIELPHADECAPGETRPESGRRISHPSSDPCGR